MNNEDIKDDKAVQPEAQASEQAASQQEASQQETSQQEAPQQEASQQETSQQEAPQQSYAVRPHHRQRRLIDYNGRDKMFKVRNYLNIAFMVLAIIGLLVYTQTDYTTLSYIIILIGVVLKIVEVLLRMLKK